MVYPTIVCEIEFTISWCFGASTPDSIAAVVSTENLGGNATFSAQSAGTFSSLKSTLNLQYIYHNILPRVIRSASS